MKLGRPTKYRKKYCEMLIQHMATGLSFETFAAVIDVNPDTIYQWAIKHSDFTEAKAIAFNKCRLFWEKTGIEGLYSQTFRKGNTSHSKTLNGTVWSLNLRSRFKEWRNVDKPDEDTDSAPPQLIIHVKQN